MNAGGTHLQSEITELVMAFAVAEIRKNYELDWPKFVRPYFVGDGETMLF